MPDVFTVCLNKDDDDDDDDDGISKQLDLTIFFGVGGKGYTQTPKRPRISGLHSTAVCLMFLMY